MLDTKFMQICGMRKSSGPHYKAEIGDRHRQHVQGMTEEGWKENIDKQGKQNKVKISLFNPKGSSKALGAITLQVD